MNKLLGEFKDLWCNNTGGKHFIVSIVKSVIRLASLLLGVVLVTTSVKASVIIIAAGLFVAELLGIAEELLDGR